MGPDSSNTAHVRCGSDIRHALGAAGFVGHFLEFSDPYCQGPLEPLPPGPFVRSRAAFLSRAYHMDEADALAGLEHQYAALRDLTPYERVVLWFEHDPYDQLILAFVLNQFGEARVPQALELVCVDRVPGVARFTGLGQLSPGQLRRLFGQRTAVTSDHLILGRRVWEALTAASPAGLQRIIETGTAPIPFMGAALKRHLQELPSTFNGTSLTQQLVLEIVAETGPIQGRDVFRALMDEREALPHLGDIMFWHVLDDMQNTWRPPLRAYTAADRSGWPYRTLEISDSGRSLLRGGHSFLDFYRGTRWVGGVRIAAGRAPFRWCRETDTVEEP